MRTLVLNGSPKGDDSVTMQLVEWLEDTHPDDQFEKRNVCREVASFEKSEEKLDALIEEMAGADLVLFAFPLYYLLVHANYKRFIELLFARDAGARLKGKHCATLSTSIHFYDHTAHAYVREVAETLGMRCHGAFSAHMSDITHPRRRWRLEQFFELVREAVVEDRVPGTTTVTLAPTPIYKSLGAPENRIDQGALKVRVITDAGEGDENLKKMIARFAASFAMPPEVLNLRDVDIKGGCLGCVRCGLDNVCVYEGKDGFVDFYREKVRTADVLIIAGAVRDRFFSSLIKTYMDRSFFKTHQPMNEKAQVGYLVSGPLGSCLAMREVLGAYAEMEGGNYLGAVTDENPDSSALDAAITGFARQAAQAGKLGYAPPKTFRYHGGFKIFRDEVYANLRFTFSADHRWYKKHKRYDFPTSKRGMVFTMNLLRVLARLFPPIKRAYLRMTVKGMLMPGRRVLNNA